MHKEALQILLADVVRRLMYKSRGRLRIVTLRRWLVVVLRILLAENHLRPKLCSMMRSITYIALHQCILHTMRTCMLEKVSIIMRMG